MNYKRSLTIFLIAIVAIVGTWAVWTQWHPTPQDDFSDIAIAFPDEIIGEENYGPGAHTKAATLLGANQHWQQVLANDDGEIPVDAWFQAQGQIAALKAAEGGITPSDAGISKDNWQWIGPGNVGGAITDIIFHPQFGQSGNEKMWASSAGGGLWKSDSGGKAWAPINDFLPYMAVTSMMIDPNSPENMYAGTGDQLNGYISGDKAVPGSGILKSTDGGDTWAPLASTSPTSDASWNSVNEMAMASDASYMLVAHASTGTPRHISRSTDGGVTWTKVLTDGSWIADVHIHPTDPTQAIAATMDGKSWYSTDNGVTWNAATGWPGGGRIEMAYSTDAAPNTTVYANLNVNKGELWKSTDGGQSFSQVNTGTGYLGNQGYIHTSIWVDPNNSNNVVVGGFEVWRSTNGGTNLTKITKYAPNKSPYADQRVATSPPGNSSLVYLGSDSGIWRTQDISSAAQFSGWESMINNLGVTRYYGLAVNQNGVVLGGTQDSGDNLFVGNPQKWQWIGFGDGGYAAADQTDPNYLYGEYIYLQIRRTSNGGKSRMESIHAPVVWRVVNGAWQKFGGAANPLQDAVDEKANFIAPFMLDPNASNRLIAGGDRLWRSNNAKEPVRLVGNTAQGPQWFPIKESIGSNISSIDVATGNSDLIWVGHNNGSIYKTTNGTADTPTWNQVDGGTLPSRFNTRITIDPNDTSGDTVYVTFGGFSSSNLWKTTNGGTNWTDISSGLPSIPLFDVLVYPGNANWLYVATEMGIYTSENGGTSWSSSSDAPANVRVTDMTWQTVSGKSTLYVSTYGRGIYKSEVDTSGGGSPTCYTLTINVSPADSGQISQSPPPNCNNGTQYTEGTSVTLTPAGTDGAVFQNWDGIDTSKSLDITMNSDQSVDANFTQGEVCYTLTTEVSPTDGGTVNVSPAPTCSDGTRYKAGTSVTLTAEPGFDFNTFEDYVFGRWTGNVQAANNPVSLVINKDETVTAGFTKPANNDGFGDADDFNDWLNTDDFFARSATGNLISPTNVFTTVAVNTSNASQDNTDPTGCEGGAGSASVWYKFTPPTTGTLTIDTTGSQYDTSLTIFEGSELNSLSEIECDDDSEDDGSEFDDEDFFDDAEFLDFFDDDEFFDDFFEDDFFDDDEFFDEDDFFDFYEEDDFFDIESDEASEEELGQLRVELSPGTTYYVMVSDTTEPELLPQLDGEKLGGINEEEIPNGGYLVMNVLFSSSNTGNTSVYLPVAIKQ